MASRSYWSSALFQGRGCRCMKPNSKPDFYSVNLSSRSVPKFSPLGSMKMKQISCRGTLPLSPKKQMVDNESDNADRIAGFCKSSPSSMASFRGIVEVGSGTVGNGLSSTTGVSPDNLDQWVQESVMEIVGNIQKAPFLLCLYSKNPGSAMKLERELVLAQGRSWPRMKKWVTETQPDGIILVEELKEENETARDQESVSQCSQLWGVLIQGRGRGSVACYILKTTRLCSAFGFCTHFCLFRAKCYSDSVEVQLKNSWLNLEL